MPDPSTLRALFSDTVERPPTGYIRLARKQWEGGDLYWDDGTKFDSRSAWTDLIQLAAWKPYRFRGVDPIQRGEFVASVRFLADRWKWSKSSVQRWLNRAEKAGRIAGQRVGQHGRIYLLVNYDLYQDTPADVGQGVGRRVGRKRDSSGTNENAVNTSNWVSRLTAVWRTEAGRVSEGQLGAMLKPAHDTFGEHVLRLAMQLWVANQKAAGRSCRLAWFADDVVQWCQKAQAAEASPVEDGWMSAEFELLTRPKAA